MPGQQIHRFYADFLRRQLKLPKIGLCVQSITVLYSVHTYCLHTVGTVSPTSAPSSEKQVPPILAHNYSFNRLVENPMLSQNQA
jgi:hypothetical protein